MILSSQGQEFLAPAFPRCVSLWPVVTAQGHRDGLERPHHQRHKSGHRAELQKRKIKWVPWRKWPSFASIPFKERIPDGMIRTLSLHWRKGLESFQVLQILQSSFPSLDVPKTLFCFVLFFSSLKWETMNLHYNESSPKFVGAFPIFQTHLLYLSKSRSL